MNQLEINAKVVELRKKYGEDENSYIGVFQWLIKFPI